MSDNLLADLNKFYNHDKLLYLYRNYLSKVEKSIPRHFSFYKEVTNPATNKNDKNYLLELLRITYLERDLFNKFLALLDEDIQQIFKILVSVRSITINDLSVKIGQRINFSLNEKNRFEVLYYLFNVKNIGIYYFLLPESIAVTLTSHFESIGDYKFTDHQIEKDLFIYEDKDNTLKKLRNYYNGLNGMDISINDKGLIEARDIERIKKQFEIKEFYDDKDKKLRNLKTKLIFNFLINTKDPNSIEPILAVKQIFKSYKDYKTNFFTYTLLEHLNFPKNFLESNKDKVKNNYFQSSMIDILSNLPVNKWICFDDILSLMENNHLYIKLISENYTDQTSFKNNILINQKISNPRLYNQAITIPAIKASMFLFSSFGLLDLAYSLPENNIKLANVNYLSVYDGLKYIKLTNLGEYIIGKSENYIYTLEPDEKISLNSKSLIIKLNKKGSIKSFLIKKFAEEIDSLNFKVTYKSFLTDCNSKKDIENKIKEFKNKISSQTFPVWESFFDEILIKSDSINQTNNFIVFQLDKDKNLLEILSKDIFLKKNIIRAENYKILVEISRIDIVRERLKDFGYFI